MGKFKAGARGEGQLIPMYLEEWLREDHLVYLVNDIVDQLNLSSLICQYSERGEEAYHPAMMLKILFYGYATGTFSSRKLERALEENIPFRWLSGGLRPDFRTISDFRKRHLKELPALFTQVVQIARELGYVTLGHVSIDGSKIKANASKHKAMSRERLKQEITRLEKEVAEILEAAQREDEAEATDAAASNDPGFPDRKARLEKIRSALKTLEEQRPEADSKRSEKNQINFTDPDSRVMDTKTQGVIQGYNPQIAVDSTQGIIVGIVMNANPSDQQQFPEILQSIEQNTGTHPDIVTADAGYFSADNINAAEEAGVDAYIAGGREGKSTGNPYDKSNFTYHPEEDIYTCPAGHPMPLKTTQREADPDKPTVRIYECAHCAECPLQKDCVKAKSGKRTVSRTEEDPVRETMRTKTQSKEGKEIYRLRKSIVEPAWGQMKQCQGFRQFHLRGVKNVSGEFLLLALSYNIRKIHSAKYPKPDTLYKREKSAQKRKTAA